MDKDIGLCVNRVVGRSDINPPPPPRILLPVSVNSRKEINLRLLAANLSVEPVFTFGPDLPFGARNLFHHTSVGPVMKYCTLQKISTGWHSIIS